MKVSKSWNVAANAYYDFINDSDFTPFIGVKIGYGSRTYGFEIDDHSSPIIKKGIDSTAFFDVARNATGTKKGIIFGATIGFSSEIHDNITFESFLYFEKYPGVETLKQEKFTIKYTESALYDAVSVVGKAPSDAIGLGLGLRFSF